MPYECTCYRGIAAFPGESTGDGPPLRCHKFEPFAVLSDYEGGFIKRWHHFLDGEQRRASVFEEWMRRQRLYPSWAMLGQLSADLKEINGTLAHMLRVAYTMDRGLVVTSEFNEVRDFMRRYYGVVVRDSGGVIERVPKDYGIGNVPLDPATPSAGLHPAHLRTVLAAIARFAR